MGVGPALLTESHALLLTTRAMKDLALGVCTGCAVVVGGLYVLGAMAGTASTHDQRRRAGGTGTPMPVVRSTTASGVVAGGGPDVYESSKSVDEYLLFHFADPSVLMPYSFGPLDATRFMQRCAELVRNTSPVRLLRRERRDSGRTPTWAMRSVHGIASLGIMRRAIAGSDRGRLACCFCVSPGCQARGQQGRRPGLRLCCGRCYF